MSGHFCEIGGDTQSLCGQWNRTLSRRIQGEGSCERKYILARCTTRGCTVCGYASSGVRSFFSPRTKTSPNFLSMRFSRRLCLWSPFSLPFFGKQVRRSRVNMSVRKNTERPDPIVASKLANLIQQSRPQRFVVDVIMRMRGNSLQKQAVLCSEFLRNCDLEILETT